MFFRSTRWFLGIAVGGAFSLAANSASAQITPDTTLPNNSTVTINGNTFNIDGGTTAGRNLFHSFQQFSVPTNGTASFNNDVNIQNIFSRVTGTSVSNIDGIIKALGTANLFLINPNGIIFGPNARLDVGGSFVGTTANAIQFGNQGFFSATNPNNPALLTVNPSALFFNQIAAAARIENNSVANAGLNPSSSFTARGLRVPDGRSLLLVGGDIKMDRGGLFAFGGRVELGGLRSAGTVGLNGDGNNLSLSFPNSVERSDVSLSNGAGVRVTAGDGGSIALNARNLEMTGSSELFAGIETVIGSDNSKAGNISVNATGAINLNNSDIANLVLQNARGQGGDVSISASSLRLEGGAQVRASTFGAGKGGNLNVDAQDVQLIGRSADGQASNGLFASANSKGDAGDLTVRTNTLLVRDGAAISTVTFDAGKGGNLRVDAQDVQLIGTSADGQFPSGLNVSAQPNSTGNAGDLTVTTNTLLVRNGAQVLTDTYGAGKGGNLNVDAQDVQIIGESADGQFASGLFASATRNSTGDAGNLTIKTNTLLVRDGAQVNAATSNAGKGGSLSVDAQDVQIIGIRANGQAASGLFASATPNSTGDAGNLTLRTNTLLVRDGAQISAGTSAAGKGGNLSVDAQDVQLIGISANGQAASGLFASATPNSTGDAGNLTLRTNTLLVRDGAQISAGTSAAGKGGNLRIDAQDVQLIGESADGKVASGLFASASQNSTGDAGDLTIKTNTLLVRDGAVVFTGTFGAGKGGNLSVDAQDVQIIGTSADGQFSSGLFASAQRNSTGNAGDITLKTNTLLVRDGATVTASTFGQRKDGTSQAGNLEINAREINLDNGSIIATTNSGNGGNIFLTLKDLLLLRNNSTISTSAGTAQAGGNGGNIIINTPNTPSGFIVAFPGENNDITANAFNGSGGQVSISTFGNYELQPLSGVQLRTLNANSDPGELPTNDITAVSQQGGPQLDGRIFINNPDVDPSNSFVSLPVDVFDPTNQIAQGCAAFDQPNASDFKVTGRGGLPPSPDEPLSSDAVWEDTRLGATTPQRLDSKTTATKPKSESDTVEIIPATGWVFNGKGEVTLVSGTPNATVENLAASSQSCRLR